MDTEAAWIRKRGTLHYGYRKHVATDDQGLVTVVVTTAANESDIVHLINAIEKAELKNRSHVKADKGYCSAANRAFLKSKNLRDGIMHKAVRGKGMTA